jgi:hypothetical protein
MPNFNRYPSGKVLDLFYTYKKVSRLVGGIL